MKYSLHYNDLIKIKLSFFFKLYKVKAKKIKRFPTNLTDPKDFKEVSFISYLKHRRKSYTNWSLGKDYIDKKDNFKNVSVFNYENYLSKWSNRYKYKHIFNKDFNNPGD